MPSAGAAPLNSCHTRLRTNLPRGSPSFQAMPIASRTFAKPSIRPGITPAKKSETIEVSVTIP